MEKKNIKSLSVEEAHNVLNLSLSKIREMARKGTLEKIQDYPIRVSESSVNEILERRKIAPPVWVKRGTP